jgi:hypothetical protein
LFPFETLKPIYDHLKVQFSDENPPFQYAISEHRDLLRQWIRLERKNAARLDLRDKSR